MVRDSILEPLLNEMNITSAFDAEMRYENLRWKILHYFYFGYLVALLKYFCTKVSPKIFYI